MGASQNCTKQECTMKDPGFKNKIRELIEMGAKNPFLLTMSDWYYLIDHAENCEYCTLEFERLAEKARKKVWFEGPTTLRKSK